MENTLTEAPASTRKPMSEEHKRKMAEGRARSLAKKKAASATHSPSEMAHVSIPSLPATPPSSTPDRRDARIAELEAQLAAKTTTAAASRPTHECFYEFRRSKLADMEKIARSDDERWAKLASGEIGPGVMNGSFIINRLSYDEATGEVTRVHETVKQLDNVPAQAAMRMWEQTGNHIMPMARAS